MDRMDGSKKDMTLDLRGDIKGWLHDILVPPIYSSWLAVSVKRTLKNGKGWVKRWEWTWVVERARESFEEWRGE